MLLHAHIWRYSGYILAYIVHSVVYTTLDDSRMMSYNTNRIEYAGVPARSNAGGTLILTHRGMGILF